MSQADGECKSDITSVHQSNGVTTVLHQHMENISQSQLHATKRECTQWVINEWLNAYVTTPKIFENIGYEEYYDCTPATLSDIMHTESPGRANLNNRRTIVTSLRLAGTQNTITFHWSTRFVYEQVTHLNPSCAHTEYSGKTSSIPKLFPHWGLVPPWVGVTKTPLISLLRKFFILQKNLGSLNHCHLMGVTTSDLRWHLSNMNDIQ